MRFHMGFSFRLRDLKKFIFPIILGLLAYLGFGGLFGFIQVNALANYDTKYNLNYNNFYESYTNYHANDSLTFILYNMISYYREHNQYYDIFITRWDSDEMSIYLINKSNEFSKNVSAYGTYSSGPHTVDFVSNLHVESSTLNNYIYILKNSSQYGIIQSAFMESFKDCLDNNPDNFTCSVAGNSTYRVQNVGTFDADVFYLESYVVPTFMNNDSDYPFLGVVPYYYSSFDIFYRNTSSIVDNNVYFAKNLNFITSNNNYFYHIGDKIYSYFDIINGNANGNTNFEDYGVLGKFFVGNIPKNHINDFTLDISYNYESYDYSSHVNYIYEYYGRINHGTYYSYEPITCSSNEYVRDMYTYSSKYVELSFFPQGFSCDSDLSNYDNIYISIEFNSDDSFDKSIYNLTFNSNYGYSKMLSNWYSSYGLYIYEHFQNLSNEFQILLSTKDNSNAAYYLSENQYLSFNLISKVNNQIADLSFNPQRFGSSYNSNALLFNLPKYYSGDTDLDLFIHFNTIVSLSDNSSFSYYNSSNTLVTGEIENDKMNYSSSSNNYSLGYYFSKVSNFIEGLNPGIIAISGITQSFWNSLPHMLTDFIVVAFIYACIYFVYLLIRK